MLDPATLAVKLCEFPAVKDTEEGLMLTETELPPIEMLAVAFPPATDTLLTVVVGRPLAVAVTE